MSKESFFIEMGAELAKKRFSKQELTNRKMQLAKKHHLKKTPTDYEILMALQEKSPGVLLTKPGRTQSGVAVVAIMTRPSACPHGKCIFCPGGPDSHFGDVPQSYTGREPASLRAERNLYNPYFQIFNRLEQYKVLGHTAEKVELIIMGGTFPAAKPMYKRQFIAESFMACNDFSRLFYRQEFDYERFKDFFELPGDIGDPGRVKRIQRRMKNIMRNAELKEEQLNNERAKIRIIALCIETRPDYCQEQHIVEMLDFGATRVELGVQILDNSVLQRVKRGHSVEDSVKATALLKDSLFKVGYHMMPGLPGSTPESDLKMLKQLFEDERFMPDALKLYPCMVMPGTELHKEYEDGMFEPMTTAQAIRLLSEFKRHVPPYCRIMRVQRDIPTKVTSAGVDKTNVRQDIFHELDKHGHNCRCIRCREPKGRNISWDRLEIKRLDYESSGGQEIFISAEAKDVLLGFCRLRILHEPFIKKLKNRAGIRELHVYGASAKLGEKGAVQHRGLGTRLLEEAEHIAFEEYHNKKLYVISGVGVREYYRKKGYRKSSPYMVKAR